MRLTPDLQRQLSRFRRLAPSADVWEGALVAMPMWVDGTDEPYRPRAAVWVSTTRHLAHTSDLKSQDEPLGPEDAIGALCVMGTSPKCTGYRPRALRVRDAALAGALREALAGDDILVETADELPALQDFLSQSAVAMSEDRIPGALTAPGVTVDRLRAFAEAAKLFFEAAPWRHLNDGDLIRIEAPKSGRGLDLLAVMGSGGQEFGLGFFSSMKKYRDVMSDASFEAIVADGGEWAVYFSPGWEIPAVDLDAWDRFALPLAGPRAYPAALRLDADREPERPDAGRLAHLEGVLRALAATTEEEMDTGRWSHRVSTAEGERDYTLTLPDLLDPSATARVRDLPPTPASPLERAQDLISEAFETRGRRQLHLIRQALALSPDCADAYVLLSERASSTGEVRSLLEQAVAAGERALGRDAATRPYMRARTALAELLAATREFDPAIEHYRALLALNPDDDQGLRYRLLATLVDAERNAEAETLLAQYDDSSALWLYPGVLLALRAGDRKLARKRLRAAVKSNRRVPAYLTGRRDIPDDTPPYFSAGGDDEAVLYAIEGIAHWEATPGAVAWLRGEMRDGR